MTQEIKKLMEMCRAKSRIQRKLAAQKIFNLKFIPHDVIDEVGESIITLSSDKDPMVLYTLIKGIKKSKGNFPGGLNEYITRGLLNLCRSGNSVTKGKAVSAFNQ